MTLISDYRRIKMTELDMKFLENGSHLIDEKRC